jgi:micrococcal nuclease
MPFFANFLALVTVAILTPLLAHAAPLEPRQEATVINVIDGDTVVLRIDERSHHLRMIGIDTPESRPNKRSEKQAERNHLDRSTILRLGNQASNFTRQLLPKRSRVLIEFDLEQRDHYGRLLGYLWLTDGRMVNEEILKSGFGYLLTVPPNVRHRERLAQAQREGRKKRRGLWSSDR